MSLSTWSPINTGNISKVILISEVGGLVWVIWSIEWQTFKWNSDALNESVHLVLCMFVRFTLWSVLDSYCWHDVSRLFICLRWCGGSSYVFLCRNLVVYFHNFGAKLEKIFASSFSKATLSLVFIFHENLHIWNNVLRRGPSISAGSRRIRGFLSFVHFLMSLILAGIFIVTTATLRCILSSWWAHKYLLELWERRSRGLGAWWLKVYVIVDILGWVEQLRHCTTLLNWLDKG